MWKCGIGGLRTGLGVEKHSDECPEQGLDGSGNVASAACAIANELKYLQVFFICRVSRRECTRVQGRRPAADFAELWGLASAESTCCYTFDV